jgi:hypothetical protein
MPFFPTGISSNVAVNASFSAKEITKPTVALIAVLISEHNLKIGGSGAILSCSCSELMFIFNYDSFFVLLDQNMHQKYIINPETGRLVKVNGTTYARLQKKGKISGKSKKYAFPHANVRWKDEAPMNTSTRRKVHAKCGGKCFLVPPPRNDPMARPKYPVCTGGDDCKIDCLGVKSALRNAFLSKNVSVQRKALSLLNKYCMA